MKPMTRQAAWLRYEQSPDPLPVDVVAIETVGNCNRACGYCPVSVAPKRQGRLADAVVYRLYDELGAIGYARKLTYHFYNEPTLDTRILDFLAYSSRKVPDATRHFTTNGDLLDRDKLLMLYDLGASIIAISAHDTETFEKFSEIRSRDALGKRLQVRPYFRAGDGSKAVRITNRSGTIDLRDYAADETREAGPEGCNRVELNIDYRGDVHPCCMDFSSGYVLGNVHDSNLRTIWQRSLPRFRSHYLGNYQHEVCLKCAKLI